jgi:hypothetical protein
MGGCRYGWVERERERERGCRYGWVERERGMGGFIIYP